MEFHATKIGLVMTYGTNCKLIESVTYPIIARLTMYKLERALLFGGKWMNVIYLFNQIACWVFHKIYHGFVRCSMHGVFVVSWCAFLCLLWAKDIVKALENVERVTNCLPWVIISGAQRVFVTLIVQHDIGINMP